MPLVREDSTKIGWFESNEPRGKMFRKCLKIRRNVRSGRICLSARPIHRDLYMYIYIYIRRLAKFRIAAVSFGKENVFERERDIPWVWFGTGFRLVYGTVPINIWKSSFSSGSNSQAVGSRSFFVKQSVFLPPNFKIVMPSRAAFFTVRVSMNAMVSSDIYGR